MWSAIILLVLLMIAIVMLSDEINNRWGYLPFLLFVAGLIFCLVAASNVPTHKVVENDKTEIVALSNGTNISGGYFLFAGSVNQSPVYYYMKKTADGGFTQDYIYAKDVTIYQDTINDGYIMRHSQYNSTNEDFRKKWNGWVWWFGKYENDTPTVSIHVPPNTIIQQYQIDLGKQ